MSQTEDASYIPLNDKRIINAWAMFDWANSSFALVIAVAVFPQYYVALFDAQEKVLGSPNISFLGMELPPSSLFSYALAFAYMIIALSLPLLSGIADYGGRKKRFMRIFTTIGSLACISLFGFYAGEDNIISYSSLLIGVFGFVLAVIGFAGGQVFYNSYLPLIASNDQVDRVSAKGFSYGYIGSVILLVINLLMIQFPETFFISDGSLAARISFIMVGVWWIGFAQITFRRLPKEPKPKDDTDLLSRGYKELRNVWRQVRQKKNIKSFLASFFFYSAGVQTVIYLAAIFATDELKFDGSELILLILILQIVAIGGAYVFSKISESEGNKSALISMLIIWMSICLGAFFVTSKIQFYFIAVLVGLVMGGIQSLSRSTYSKLIPANTTDTASYFSFFDVLEKVAIVLGTFSFGLIAQIMGSMRNSVLALIIYFVIGLLILMTVNMRDAEELEAQA
ncbi:MAG: MFS transporter [Bacteroidota bacterium]